MIAVDTNILVYAHREDSVWHESAYARLKELAESGLNWAIPWACIHEFLAIVTHPKIYKPPTPLSQAIRQVEVWIEVPTLNLIGEGNKYWDKLKPLLESGKVQGGAVHDFRIAGVCLEAGVTKLWSADKDFSRIPSLRVENPLIRK